MILQLCLPSCLQESIFHPQSFDGTNQSDRIPPFKHVWYKNYVPYLSAVCVLMIWIEERHIPGHRNWELNRVKEHLQHCPHSRNVISLIAWLCVIHSSSNLIISIGYTTYINRIENEMKRLLFDSVFSPPCNAEKCVAVKKQLTL
jgi:hypothetical protein